MPSSSTEFLYFLKLGPSIEFCLCTSLSHAPPGSGSRSRPGAGAAPPPDLQEERFGQFKMECAGSASGHNGQTWYPL